MVPVRAAQAGLVAAVTVPGVLVPGVLVPGVLVLVVLVLVVLVPVAAVGPVRPGVDLRVGVMGEATVPTGAKAIASVATRVSNRIGRP